MLSLRNQATKRNTAAALVIGVSLIAILLVGAVPSRAATTTYDNVQISIQTTNLTFTGTFTVTAYNSTGYALVTYVTPYPAASFELPGASYIFTVSAVSEGLSACPLLTPASASATSTQTTSSSSSSSTVVQPPCVPGAPESEYGYAAQQISGSTPITISTTPYQDLLTTTITVHTQYVNGTAAARSSVAASILGGQGYGVFGPTPLSMSGVTDSNGNVNLIVPKVPLQVTGSKWVHVKVTSDVLTVGGQGVSVTANRGLVYEMLTGSTVLVPPQTTATIVLQNHQSVYAPASVNARR